MYTPIHACRFNAKFVYAFSSFYIRHMTRTYFQILITNMGVNPVRLGESAAKNATFGSKLRYLCLKTVKLAFTVDEQNPPSDGRPPPPPFSLV